MTGKDMNGLRRQIEKAERLLATITSPATAASIAKQVSVILSDLSNRLGGTTRKPRGQQFEYRVEASELGETLTERRPGNVFRCPKHLYEAIVMEVAKADAPISAAEIVAGVSKTIGVEVAAHQYGVVLRFLLVGLKQPLIVRTRKKYHPVAPATFLQNAKIEWNSHRIS